MRVSLTVRGGNAAVVNRTMPSTVVDTASLPSASAQDLRGIVRNALRESGPAVELGYRPPDGQHYRIEIDDDGDRFVVEGSDATMPVAVSELVDWLLLHGPR